MFKPPPYLHVCTTNLPNMEGIVSKTTNSLPKVMLVKGLLYYGIHFCRQFLIHHHLSAWIWFKSTVVRLKGRSIHVYQCTRCSSETGWAWWYGSTSEDGGMRELKAGLQCLQNIYCILKTVDGICYHDLYSNFCFSHFVFILRSHPLVR